LVAQTSNKPSSSAKPKLLVVELWGVGDLIMAAPFLREASEKFSVTLLAKPFAEELKSRFWPEVEVIPFTAPWTVFKHKYRLHHWNWSEIFHLIGTLRSRRFDVGLSARWDPRDHLLLKAFGVKRRFGFARAGSRLALNHPVERPPFGTHRYEHWRALGSALNLDVPKRASIPLPQARQGFILVHSGAAQPVRVWPLERFRNLVLHLRAKGFDVRIACDESQRAWWLTTGEHDVATPRTITELAHLTAEAALFIGNDSGPGHLAAFSGVPTFTIFGPQLPELFAPLHPASEWIEGKPCVYRPCSDYCHFSVPHCMWNLSEDEVFGRVDEFLKRHVKFFEDLSSVKSSFNADSVETVRNEFPVPAKPRRILLVNNSADIYGASRMLLRFVKTLDRRRFDPVIVLPEKGLLKDCLEAAGVEVILHPRLSIITRSIFHSWRIGFLLWNYSASVWFLWRLIRRRRIELVQSNTGVILSPAMAARLAGVPHVWHIRDWFQEFRSFWPAFAAYIRKFSRKIVAVSNAVANQFEPRGHATVIHDGFSIEEFCIPRQELRDDFRLRYGLGKDFVVGCVGRIKWVRKGQEILVQATALLKKRGVKIKALIVGAPFPGNEDHLAQLQQLVRDLEIEDQVVFTDEIPDARPAYAAMDLMALTSAQPEPFGGVVMEAMAMGVPVIATNIGGSLDQVVEGKTGLLIPPGNPEALAEAIEKLMRDSELRKQMGIAAVARIETQFTLAEMTVKMEQLFEKVISDKNLRNRTNGKTADVERSISGIRDSKPPQPTDVRAK
ncbi:MAG TPA: glycosyltransferase, partial [Verrucomicrobiae bacterium]|nr:glycosyltransferase [Verrucomicrobiae bacterium]